MNAQPQYTLTWIELTDKVFEHKPHRCTAPSLAAAQRKARRLSLTPMMAQIVIERDGEFYARYQQGRAR